MDKKLEMLFAKETVAEMSRVYVNKGLNKSLVSRLCEPEFRAGIASIIESGEYNVAPPHIGRIPKDDGSFREVFINEDLDRIVLSLIGVVYSELYGKLIHERCVSYKKGVGARKIMSSITSEINRCSGGKHGTVVGYKIDISKYFDSLSKEHLYKALDELDSGSCVDAVVQKYYRDDIIFNSYGDLVEHYKSIAQGCAISPFLANYCLRDVDDVLSRMDIIYYRYSDDILIIGNDADAAVKALSAMLACKGLKINPKKVEKIRSGEWFTFIGFRVNGEKISFSNKSLKTFQKEIKLLTQPKKDDMKAVKKSVRGIQKYLYTAYMKSSENFGWAEYFFSVVNVEEDIIELDKFIKDRLRGVYTGRTSCGGLGVSNNKSYGVAKRIGKNVGTNKERVSNEQLVECGYISMHHLYKLFLINKDLYRTEVLTKMGT